jgi:hypothetical protein
MSMRHESQPYMIYTGPLPRHVATPDPRAAEATPGNEAHEQVDAPSKTFPIGNGLLIAGALVVGVAMGIWVAPNVRPASAIVEREPPALTLTSPTEAPPPTVIDAPSPVLDAAPRAERLSTTVGSGPAAGHRQREVKVARNAVARPKAHTEPAKRPAAHRETPRSSPTDLADARGDPVADLIASIEDPPH